MKILSILLTSSIFFTFISCKTKSQANNSVVNSNQNSNVYSLVVSFYSIGMGTDYQSKKKFDEMVINFEEQNKTKITIETYPWGREGEVDLCINLKSLSKKLADDFVNKAKAIATEGKHIRVTENSVCTKKDLK